MNIKEMDIRGKVCPSSLLLVLREVNQNYEAIASGQHRLLVRTDNRDATGTIPSAVQNMGFHVMVEKVEGHYCIEISGSNDQEQGLGSS